MGRECQVAACPPLWGPLNADLARQLLLLPFFMLLVGGVLSVQVTQAFSGTSVLLVVVTCSGIALISGTRRALGDWRLQRLGYVFLVKVGLALWMLYAGWTPQLDPSAEAFGYDPQRFYFQAYDLAQQGFRLEALPSLNYTGVLYYYGAVFAIFGHNPVNPLLVNAFVTLVAVLLLVRTGYQIRGVRGRLDWTLGLCMVIPEIVWFDMMTSR